MYSFLQSSQTLLASLFFHGLNVSLAPEQEGLFDSARWYGRFIVCEPDYTLYCCLYYQAIAAGGGLTEPLPEKSK